VVVEQGPEFNERFWAACEAALHVDRLKQMAASFSTLRRPPAIASIGDLIERALKES
jgi:hypothetical protein